jgi:uncharacterized protein YjbJ (UPF0337 family)
MKTSTKDQIKGKAREVGGHIQKEAGKAMNRPDIEDKGRGQQFGGKVQKKVGEIEKVFEN